MDYDEGGNILSKKVYGLDEDGTLGNLQTEYIYTYDSKWKDQLVSRAKTIYEYDPSGSADTFNETETFTYDALGNPTAYKGNTLTWTDVRRLASYGNNTFAYGADGIRYKKNNITYTLDGSRILKETDGTKTLIYYYYGESGVIGFNYNGADYYYRKNLQGDVVAIYNASGSCVAEYSYDAWGVCKAYSPGGVAGNTSADFIGNINPFRYRGYYYDVETGLYYLETRYYDPEVGRFINSDGLDYLGWGAVFSNFNLFVYCCNNPVMWIDSFGGFPKFVKEFLEQFDDWVQTPFGLLRYVFEYTKKGELYEFWVDQNGKVRWCRHHSNHGNSKRHPHVPHDHEWHDDDNGNNTQDKTGLPPNPDFHAPDSENNDNTSDNTDNDLAEAAAVAAGSAIVAYLAYEVIKWIIATLAAPATGGVSLGIAGATP